MISDAEAGAGTEQLAGKAGRLVVLSGPAGVGKTTVAERLCREAGIKRSISATTRQPRADERDGRDYFFLTEEEFNQRLASGGFLEHARVHGFLYGTPRGPVEQAVRAGEARLLVIDVQGAMQVRQAFREAVLIFLDAPDAVLDERLERRHTEDLREREARRAIAAAERRCKEHYDYCVTNDDVERTAAELRTIICRGRKPGDRRPRVDG